MVNVGVIGAGYVGLTTAAVLAYLGHEVRVVDKQRQKIDLLRAAVPPIREAGLGEILSACKERLSFSHGGLENLADSDLVFICVGTPPGPGGKADTAAVEEVAAALCRVVTSSRIRAVVIKSTVPPGTARRVAGVMSSLLRGTGGVSVVSNPEFLREGMALQDGFYPARMVIGADQRRAADLVADLYRPLLEQSFPEPEAVPRPHGYSSPRLIITDPTTAEMIKYASNAFLAVKISFINEVAAACERLGANIDDVVYGVGSDPRIGHAWLQPGLGWGGSCLPKDTAAFLAAARDVGCDMRVLEAARRVNHQQRLAAVEKLKSFLGDLSGRTVAVLGLAFKPGTDDVRDSPALELIELLLAEGASVRGHDPMVAKAAAPILSSPRVSFAHNPYDAAEGADALVVATAWEEYASLNLGLLLRRMRGRLLLDGRNLLDPKKARDAGFVYEGVGR